LVAWGILVSSRQSAVSSQQSAVSSQQSAVSSQQSAVGSRQSAVGSQQSAVSNRPQASGFSKIAKWRSSEIAKIKKLVISIQHLASSICFLPVHHLTSSPPPPMPGAPEKKSPAGQTSRALLVL